ncbi:MAG: DUF2953 domain-containing protein [Christensenellales bacterium]
MAVPVRLKLWVRFVHKTLEIKLRVGLLRGLLPVSVHVRLKRKVGRLLAVEIKVFGKWKEKTDAAGLYAKFARRKTKQQPDFKLMGDWFFLRQLNVDCSFGIEGHADKTAILYGFLCGLLPGLVVHINKRNKNTKSSIKVNPVFTKEVFEMDATCIVDLFLEHIIIDFIKNRRKQEGGVLNGKTSHRKHHANHYGAVEENH